MAPPTLLDPGLGKPALRRLFVQQRRALSLAEQQQTSQQLLPWIPSIPAFLSAQHIAAYWPMDGEISPLPLLEAAWQQGKDCYLPCLLPGADSLDFRMYRPHDPLHLHPLGFRTPDPDAHPPIPIHHLDLILVPLLAFDTRGHRLGRGGGFYDRSLALSRLASTHRAYWLGVGYAAQGVDRLPVDPWDVPLDGVLTEEGYTCF